MTGTGIREVNKPRGARAAAGRKQALGHGSRALVVLMLVLMAARVWVSCWC